MTRTKDTSNDVGRNNVCSECNVMEGFRVYAATHRCHVPHFIQYCWQPARCLQGIAIHCRSGARHCGHAPKPCLGFAARRDSCKLPAFHGVWGAARAANPLLQPAEALRAMTSAGRGTCCPCGVSCGAPTTAARSILRYTHVSKHAVQETTETLRLAYPDSP